MKLTMQQMILDPGYHTLAEDLKEFPLPDWLRLRRRRYAIPLTPEHFARTICYGQRLFFTREACDDFDAIVRLVGGYYYPLVMREKWHEDSVARIAKYILPCKVIDLYPVAMMFLGHMTTIIERETALLHRELTKTERAAGVERLQPFNDLISLDFLRDAMKVTTPEVLLTPYNECLVRFMMHKEVEDYRERYADLLRIEQEHKLKKQKK